MANSPGLSESHVQYQGNHLADMDTVARIINEDHSNNSVSPGASTVTPDVHVATTLTINLTGNITLAAPTAGSGIGPFPSQRITFVFVQDATGGRTVAWNAAYVGAPLVDPTASSVTTVTFINTGSTASPTWRVERTASGVYMLPSGLVVIQGTDTSVQAALVRLDAAVANPGPPSGTAGGDLSGAYPDPSIGAGVIDDSHISSTAAIDETKLDLSLDPYGTPGYRSSPYRVKVGNYITDANPGTVDTSAGVAMSDNVPFFGMLWIPATCTLDTLGVRVATAGSAGSVLRIGLVETDDDGNPIGTVLSDQTVASTTTGAKTVTPGSPIQVTGGRWYAVAVTSQGTPTTKPILWSSTTPFGYHGSNGSSVLFSGYFYNVTVSGAYPSSFPSANVFSTSNFRPIAWAHVSSRP